MSAYSDLPDWQRIHHRVLRAGGNEEILDPIEQFIYDNEPGGQFHPEDCATFRTQLAELIKFVEAAESLAARAKLGKFIQAIDRVEAAE